MRTGMSGSSSRPAGGRHGREEELAVDADSADSGESACFKNCLLTEHRYHRYLQ